MRKIIIIGGGGFFGMYLAEQFSLLGHGVKLFEKENNYMSRASYNNQARVHNGYVHVSLSRVLLMNFVIALIQTLISII